MYLHPNFIFAVTYLICPGALAFGFCNLAYRWYKTQQAADWFKVKGCITRSEIIQKRSTGFGPQGSHFYTFGADIEYTYKVGSKEYRGNKVCLCSQFTTSWQGPAKERCARYPVGATVDVYVNPRDADESVLEPHTEGNWFVVAVMGVFAFIWLAAILY